MAIVPKRKISKQRKRLRRSHNALKLANLVSCQNCQKKIQQHRVCKFCGFYKKRKIIVGLDDNK